MILVAWKEPVTSNFLGVGVKNFQPYLPATCSDPHEDVLPLWHPFEMSLPLSLPVFWQHTCNQAPSCTLHWICLFVSFKIRVDFHHTGIYSFTFPNPSLGNLHKKKSALQITTSTYNEPINIHPNFYLVTSPSLSHPSWKMKHVIKSLREHRGLHQINGHYFCFSGKKKTNLFCINKS